LLDNKIFSEFDPSRHSLSELSAQLLEQQKKAWKQLGEGYASLSSVRERAVACNGFSVRLQWNPRRIVSTAAFVDEKSIQQRKCFLCPDNLPEAQQGVLYRHQFLVLGNPAPIFPEHFTISHVEHVPQTIESNVDVFLELAADFSGKFGVFYNGPRCGASAPDHLHFQACPRNSIPAELDAVDARRRKILHKSGSLALVALKDYGRSVVVVEATDKERLIGFIHKMIASWRNVGGISEEPMMNVLCIFREMVWRVIIFFRSKHRPDVFFRTGNDRVVISPAAVDMGGLIITPVETDFHRVDNNLVESIFREVSLDGSQLQAIVGRTLA
jgi:hypothetical protein